MERVSYVTLVIYNASIFLISLKAWSGFNFESALSEKDPDVMAAQADAATQIVDAHKQIAAMQVANPPSANSNSIPKLPSVPNPLASSYSRVTGMFGLIIIASFLWAFGNALIWSMFNAAENVSKITSGVSSFFLSGSALFAPYAFNQIKEAFNK